jgi:hemolysin activation/secretion protein
VLYLEKPIAKKGLSLNSIYPYSSTKTKDLFPLTSGESINRGTSEYISLGISYPFVLRRNLEIGMDISTTIQNSHQDLYQDNVRSNNVSTDRIRAVRVGLNGRKSLKRSYNTARFLFSQGIEGWDDTLTGDQQKSNLNSKANFSTYKLDLSRQQYIGNSGLALEFNASGQIASAPLPTPEKFSFGGPDYGRGFSNSHIFGDAGWSSSVQLTKNMYSKNGRTISPFVWYDYGSVDDLTGDTRELSASTYGIGIRGDLNPDTSYIFSVAVPGQDDSNPTKTGLDHKIFKFNIGLQF